MYSQNLWWKIKSLKDNDVVMGCILCFGVIITAAIPVFLFFDYFADSSGPYDPIETKVITIPIPQHIETIVKTTKTKQGRAHIVEKIYGFFGVGVGVGMGAVEIYFRTPEDFLAEIPPGEKIYTCVKELRESEELEQDYSRFNNGFILIKRYFAFIKNRAGLAIYEEQIVVPYNSQKGERVKFIGCDGIVAILQLEIPIKRQSYLKKYLGFTEKVKD